MTSQKPTTVKCPKCEIQVEWIESNQYRPFCSERCKNSDFLSWANEEHHIPGSPTYDDLLSGDLEDY